MKKVLFSGIVLFSTFVLGACNNSSQNNSNSNNNTTATKQSISQKKWVEQNAPKHDLSFDNGVLKVDSVELKIDEAQFATDNFSKEKGVIIWYTVTNSSKENIVPKDYLSYLSVKQKDSTSEYKIETTYNYFSSADGLFPMYDSEGQQLDTDAYNKAIDDQNNFEQQYEKKGSAELLPGASVQTVIGLTLNNLDYPVTIKAEDETAQPNNTYTINP